MIDIFFVDKQVILATTAPMPSVMAVMNLATLHRAAPTRFLPLEHHNTKTDLIQGINIPTPKGTDHTPPIMIPDMGDILAGHSPITIPTVTEAAILQGIPHVPLPATTAAHATLLPMDTPIPTHALTPTDTATPHPTHHFSHRCHSHHSTDQSQSCSSNSHHTAQESQPRRAKQCPRPSTPI